MDVCTSQHFLLDLASPGQVCLPVKWLDLGYNLVKTHDGSSAFLVVDHDEEELIAARAPIGNVYASGATGVATSCYFPTGLRPPRDPIPLLAEPPSC